MVLRHGIRFLKFGSYTLYRLAFWLTLVAAIGLAALVIALNYFLLPRIDEYRQPIVNSVAQAIGQSVEIGRIEGGWRDYRPSLTLFNVHVHEAGGSETLALDRVDTVLSWKSLIAGKIVFYLIEFAGSNLELRRDSLGTLWVAGKAIERKPPGERSRALAWLFAQHQIIVSGAEVTWIDEMRAAPTLRVTDVRLLIENNGRRHRFAVTGSPPAELASAVTVNGEFFGKDIEDFSGQGRLHAEFEYANLAYAQEWLPLPLDLDSGLGVMRLWIDIDNRSIRRVIAEGDLVNVAGRFGKELDTFALASLSGRVQWEEEATAKTIALSNLTFEAVDGMRLPPANISMRTPRSAASRRELRIRSLELAPLAELSRFLPLDERAREMLVSLQPGGMVDSLRATWPQRGGDLRSLTVDGRFRRLAIQPVGKLPGFSGITGAVAMADGGGTFALEAEGAMLDYPQLLAEPIPFDFLDADGRWESDAKQLHVTLGSVSFTNEHAAGKFNGTYFYPGTGRGEIDLRAVLVRAEAQHLWRYFPNRIAKTRGWLQQGLVSGHSDRVKVHLAGPLDKFPFDDEREGRFEISAFVRDAAIRIGEDWPLIEDVNGDFLINGKRIDIKPRSGRIMGADVSRSTVSILDIGTRQVRLSVDGKAAGQVDQYLQFVANSPVARYTKGATAGMRGQGRGQLSLRLELPFFHPADTRVDGQLDLSGPVLMANPRIPTLRNYAVRVEFDRDGVALRNGRGRMLGGDVRFSSAVRGDGRQQLDLGGQAQAGELAAFLRWPMLKKLHGRTEWKGNLRFDADGSHLQVESTLVGVGSRLPAPLDKLEAIALPIRFDLWTSGQGRSEYAVRLEKVGSARLAARNGELERGAIVFGGPAQLPSRRGVFASGEVTSLDYDGWRDLIAGSRAAESPAVADKLVSLNLGIGKFRFGGRSFNDLRIIGEYEKQAWQINLAGPQMAGNLVITSDADGRERINGRFTTLSLAPDEPSISVPASAVAADAAVRRRIPAALNVIVEAFEFEDKPLGRLELLAEPIEDGWQLERLAISNPDGRIDVKGEWRIAGRPHAEYSVRFEAIDNGKLLKRLGYEETIVGGTGSLSGPVSWLGGPFRPDLPTLSGKLKLQVADGRFAQVDPGAAQLIGILSLQALPRRITLNFKDVFSTGFSFDRIEADVTVTEGVARTDDFRMEGVAAEVTMKGEVNLVAETQDLEVHVRPMLSSAAAVAGAAVVNPLVGVATLLVQKALGDPVEQAASRDYRVTGTWGNPQVTRIERAPAQAEAPAGR